MTWVSPLPSSPSAMDRVTTLEAPRLSADQLPPDLLLASDENTRDDSPTTVRVLNY